MYKKVSLERLVAAIIDSILVSIVTSIPGFVYFASKGIGELMDYLLNSNDEKYLEDMMTFSLITFVFGLIFSIIYFVYLPYKSNGQTPGKKLLRIKAIDEFGNNPTFKQHFIRAIQNWNTYAIAPVMLLILVNMVLYSIVETIVISLVTVVVTFTYLMILIREDGRGLHDIISETRVVRADYDLDEEFVTKTTQMGEWADVVNSGDEEDEEDPWS